MIRFGRYRDHLFPFMHLLSCYSNHYRQEDIEYPTILELLLNLSAVSSCFMYLRRYVNASSYYMFFLYNHLPLVTF